MSTFVGVFSNLLSEFITFKRSMGYKYITEAQTLAEFSRFTTQFEIFEPMLTKEIVNAWCEQHPFENRRSSTEHRISNLRQFALYLASLGYKVCIPVYSRNNHQPRYAAYIFTHEEIKKIFESCDRVFPYRHSNVHLVMPVLIRLLYSSGLRISEAVGLQMKHVDLKNGVLEIKKAKNGKDRLVPLSNSMRDICIRYCQAIHRNSTNEDYFFVNAAHEPYCRATVYWRFREILVNYPVPRAQGVLATIKYPSAIHPCGRDRREFLPIH
ncbi:MAG: tyrosine-type recombinase/integrase [Candidatus Desantisbacteria bacterium]